MSLKTNTSNLQSILNSDVEGAPQSCAIDLLINEANIQVFFTYLNNGEPITTSMYYPVAITPELFESLNLRKYFDHIVVGSTIIIGVPSTGAVTPTVSYSGEIESLDGVTQPGFTAGLRFLINGNGSITYG